MIKMFMSSLFIGVISSLAVNTFFYILSVVSEFTGLFDYFYLFLPVFLVFSIFIIRNISDDARSHSTDKFIYIINHHSGFISGKFIIAKFLASIITIASGGSAGRNGPAAQISVGIISLFTRKLNLSLAQRQTLVIVSLCSSFTAIFGALFGGLFFGVEMLGDFRNRKKILVSALPACFMSYLVTSKLNLFESYNKLSDIFYFDLSLFIPVIIGAIIFGLFSFVFINTLFYFRKLSMKAGYRDYSAAFFCGLLTASLTFVIGSQYLGLGLESISSYLSGNIAGLEEPFLKAFFTSITLNFGGSGGLISPIFYMGTSLGTFFGDYIGYSVPLFAALGMVGVLSGCTNTPIASAIIAIEMFGYEIAPYAVITTLISYLMTKNATVYLQNVSTDIGKHIAKKSLQKQ